MMLRTRRHGADSRLIERFLLLVCALTHVVFDVFHFIVPFSTDADPTSHRVRLWRGGSASKVLLHRLFFRRVHPHARPEVFNGPWLLLWSRGDVEEQCCRNTAPPSSCA